MWPKNLLIKILSFGITPNMEENKKIAIQIASFDAIASLIAFIFYFFYSLKTGPQLIVYCHAVATLLGLFGIALIAKKKYDGGRFLIFFVGLAEIFINVDGVMLNSGFEFYYFAPLIVPFFVFSPEELSKSISLSLCGFGVFAIQQLTGPGIINDHLINVSISDRVVTLTTLFIYIIGLFSISRWQMNNAQRKIKAQQSELIHISNIAALGEMSGGIAHEINNPLQILTTQIFFLKKQLKDIEQVPKKTTENLEMMEMTVHRIAKLVKGLKNLSRNVTNDPPTIFPIKDAIDDMLAVSAQKLRYLEIKLEIKGNTTLMVKGYMVQLSQTLINLLNNAVDAIDGSPDKWVLIEISDEGDKIHICVSDSGKGIPKDVAAKIMQPFFTTKEPGRGTGLGLSISRSLIEKVGGRLYYSPYCLNTKFVIELPKVDLMAN